MKITSSAIRLRIVTVSPFLLASSHSSTRSRIACSSVFAFVPIMLRNLHCCSPAVRRSSSFQLRRFSESIRPFPNFRKRLSVRKRPGLGERISVHLDGELLILPDETGSDDIAREVHVFGIGTSVQDVGATGCIEWFPVLRIVGGK